MVELEAEDKLAVRPVPVALEAEDKLAVEFEDGH